MKRVKKHEVCTSQVGNKLSISSIKISFFTLQVKFYSESDTENGSFSVRLRTIENVCTFKNGAD